MWMLPSASIQLQAVGAGDGGQLRTLQLAASCVWCGGRFMAEKGSGCSWLGNACWLLLLHFLVLWVCLCLGHTGIGWCS